MAVMLFSLYVFAIGSWCVANLLDGEFEYLLKFLSWYILLGGLFQSSLMLVTGTLNLNSSLYAVNWGVAVLIYYLIFRYVKSFIIWSDFLKYSVIIMIFLGTIFSVLKFLGRF
jgi:hypothetical protein